MYIIIHTCVYNYIYIHLQINVCMYFIYVYIKHRNPVSGTKEAESHLLVTGKEQGTVEKVSPQPED